MATIQTIGNFQPVRESGNGKQLPSTPLANKPTVATDEKTQNASPSAVLTEAAERRNVKDGLGAEELQQQLEKFAQSEQNIRRSLRFKVDTDTGSTVIKVIDQKTDETIRQIPPEELLTLSKRLKELNDDISKAQGVFIKTEV